MILLHGTIICDNEDCEEQAQTLIHLSDKLVRVLDQHVPPGWFCGVDILHRNKQIILCPKHKHHYIKTA